MPLDESQKTLCFFLGEGLRHGLFQTWGLRESLKLDYDPIVHVEALKPKRGRPAKGVTLPALVNAAREAFKYAVKPSDMIADGGVASGTHPAVG